MTERFCEIMGSERVFTNEPMKRHTTFKLGGNADYYLCPKDRLELASVIRLCRQADIPFIVIGNGSNLLVSDDGFRGAVISTFENMRYISINDEKIRAGAGALLSKLASFACDNSLGGLEFAAGIPGTVGGAVFMNAGAYGGEMKDVVCEVEIVDNTGAFVTLRGDELDMGYRSSRIMREACIVTDVVLKLQHGNSDVIRANIEELKIRRQERQPLEYPSAGSTFKRPDGYFAGKLIMDSGLAGYRIGGACVSRKHCGFVINDADATALDVYRLIRYIQQTVQDKFGVFLDTEVRIVGRFDF